MTAHARRGDPETSHEAAASVRETRTQQLCESILLVLADGFMRALSDEQIAAEIQERRYFVAATESGLRTRRSELVKAGLVAHYGYGTTRAGRACRLWKITTEGLQALVRKKENS